MVRLGKVLNSVKGIRNFKVTKGRKDFVNFNNASRVNKKPWATKFKKKFVEKRRPFSRQISTSVTFDRRFNLCLWIRQTYNNIFLTVTDTKGMVRFVISGGFSKLRGNNRASHRSIEIITRILIKRLARTKIRRIEFKTLCVFLVTPKNSVIKSLLNLLRGISKIQFIAARLRIPHNGIRLKKLRRL